MKKTQTARTAPPVKRAKEQLVQRLNGAEHWQSTLDRFLWILLRAGIDPREIASSTARSLKDHRHTRPVRIPPPEVLEYVRVITHWRNEPLFLDEHGEPRSLPWSGGASSFRSLVRDALPGTDIEHVVEILRQHELITVGRNRRITLRASAFLLKNENQTQFIAHTLSVLEGIIGTCHRNLTSRKPSDRVGRLQRVALAERFDLKYLQEYDIFLRDQATDFLQKQDAWLKRHEVKPTSKRGTVAHVGVGIFGFRAR